MHKGLALAQEVGLGTSFCHLRSCTVGYLSATVPDLQGHGVYGGDCAVHRGTARQALGSGALTPAVEQFVSLPTSVGVKKQKLLSPALCHYLCLCLHLEA